MTAALLLTSSIIELTDPTSAPAVRRALAALARLDLDVVVLRGMFSDPASAEAAMLGVVEVMGCRPHAYAAPNSGHGGSDLITSSPVADGLHTACAHLPMPGEGQHLVSPSPDFVCFGCLGGEIVAPSTFVTASDVLGRLSGNTVEALKEPDFTMPGASGRMSILYEDHAGRCLIRYDAAAMDGATPAARKALQGFRDRLADPALRQTATLRSGDLMLVNNRAVLHAGGGRLLRLFASRPKSFPHALPAPGQPYLWLT
jgi:hypothetical protein